MPRLTAIFTMLAVLVAAVASAQPRGGVGGVLDVLSETLGLDRTVRGHVVQHREATLVLRGDDQRIYTINTAGLDVAALGRLKEGRPVGVTLKSPGPGAMPIAAAIQVGQGPAKVFRRVEGTVQRVEGDRITFGARDGQTITLDRARIVGEPPRVAPNETATLVYEDEPQVAGVWIDTREVQPSAAVPEGGYQRVRGFVEALGLGTLTLKADDGRSLVVDTTQLPEPVRVRPGDLVSVIGKPSPANRERFIAEVVQKD